MLKCKHCGAEYEEGRKYCPTCGVKLPSLPKAELSSLLQEVEKQKESLLRMKARGEGEKSGAKQLEFSDYVNDASEGGAKRAPAKKKERRVWWRVPVFALLAAAAACCCFFPSHVTVGTTAELNSLDLLIYFLAQVCRLPLEDAEFISFAQKFTAEQIYSLQFMSILVATSTALTLLLFVLTCFTARYRKGLKIVLLVLAGLIAGVLVWEMLLIIFDFTVETVGYGLIMQAVVTLVLLLLLVGVYTKRKIKI